METDPIMVKRKALLSVLDQCREALESLDSAGRNPNSASKADDDEEGEAEGGGSGRDEHSDDDSETDKLCDLVKSKIEAPNFLEKLGSMNMSVMDSIYADESSSWNMVTAKDLWEDKDISGEIELDQDSYVLVSQDDIMEGIACFISTYLLSLKQANDVTPNQLQNALSKTFSVKKKKSKLHKAWDGSKVIYNVASWSATAIGIYQNPALFGVASTAFWTSCRVLDSYDTYSIFIYGTGALVALWLSSAVGGALDSIPVIPNVFEVVGLAYTIWFCYHYLIFKKNRKELFAKIDEIKGTVIGLDN